MKKIVKNILIDLLIVIFLCVIIIFFLVYFPKDSKNWERNILESSPEEYSKMTESREILLENFDTFVLDSSTEKSKKLPQLIFSKQFKLNYHLQENTLSELKEDIPKEKIRVWYVYNMGIIVKSISNVICFDLSTVIATPNLLDLSEQCDYLILSHGDGDHFSPSVVRKVLNTGGKVVLQDQSKVWEGVIKALVSEDLHENIINVEDMEEYVTEDVSFYGLKTKHRGEERSNTWFRVDIDGFRIVHTGDGVLNSYEEWNLFKEIDLLLANTIVQPIDLEDSEARYIVPLHLHEIAHGREFLTENSYGGFFDKLQKYEGSISSKIYPLLWGESILIEKIN